MTQEKGLYVECRLRIRNYICAVHGSFPNQQQQQQKTVESMLDSQLFCNLLT